MSKDIVSEHLFRFDHIPKEYVPYVEKFTNSNEFRERALFFKKEKCYTKYAKNTFQYKEFWKEERRRCLEGFTNSKGIRITGQHYFYLNYVQILLDADNDTRRKVKDFPRFVDLDYYYFHLLDYCRAYEKSLVSVKGRRQGWSYKASGVSSHEFNFFRDSSTIIGAYLSDYSSNTMKMVLDNCNFLNTYTEFGRIRNPDTQDLIKARYQVDVEGKKVWKGLMSSVEAITFKDRPSAGVGRTASWLILDESGIFPNIIEAYGLSEPLIKDGSNYTGVCIMFGSSDNMETGSIHFKKIFTEPDLYNMLGFKDPKNEERTIGFFSAAYFGRWGKCKNKNSTYYGQDMVDEDGNSNIFAAIDDLLANREKLKKSPDPMAYRNFVTQFPIYWEEAFLISAKSPFPTYLAEERLADLETKSHLNVGQAVKLNLTEDNVLTREISIREPIKDFPISKAASKEGCIEIFEEPYQENPAWGTYIAGIDPYDDDYAENSESLGSTLVMHALTGRIVAEYTARPETAKQYYENVRRLLMYYNAITNYENNKKGLFGHFEQKNSLYLLCDTPKILKDTQIVKTTYTSGNQSKGTGTTEAVNVYGNELIKTWMLEQAQGQENGITNTMFIPSKPLLKEIIYWNPKLNADRISALRMVLILKEDRFKLTQNINTDNYEDISKHRFFAKHFSGYEDNRSSYIKLNNNFQ